MTVFLVYCVAYVVLKLLTPPKALREYELYRENEERREAESKAYRDRIKDFLPQEW